MATEHNEQSSPANTEKGKDGFEIEDIGLEEAAGGAGYIDASCGGPCASCVSCAPRPPAS